MERTLGGFAANAMITPDVDRRWFLGEGDERCPFCLQGYALEVEVRCSDCDGPGCPHCVVLVRETRTRACPPCVPAGTAGEEV